jgi:hypothetical protein
VGWLGLGFSRFGRHWLETDARPWWLSLALCPAALRALPVDRGNVRSKPFYGFGWESMLLEAGFFARLTWGQAGLLPSLVPVAGVCAGMLFRVELGRQV